MEYGDRFLRALGQWQSGWREDPGRRRAVTAELESAIAGLRAPLPRRVPPPVCYRKRFLLPGNPQNPWELSQLILAGGVHDGIASWTTDPEYGRAFKELVRPGQITALFRHRPKVEDVLVDIPRLWEDRGFVDEVERYAALGGEHGRGLTNFRDVQGEIILSAPLRLEDVFGLVGQIGTYDQLFALAGARTDEERDDLVDRIIEANCYPGQARWVDREGAQRILLRARARMGDRVVRAVRRRPEAAWLAISASPSTLAWILAQQCL